MIVRPESTEASCYFGQGTRWCISATQSTNYFDQYSGQGKAFYFVNFTHLGPYSDTDFVGASAYLKSWLLFMAAINITMTSQKKYLMQAMKKLERADFGMRLLII
jgi:hypothetical protein